MSKQTNTGISPWRSKLHEVIFEAETKSGKTFDISLLIIIVISILVVMLESVPDYRDKFGTEFTITEWIITGIFSLEYLLRILSVKKPLSYIFSFYGLIDLLSILPSYLGIFISGTSSLIVLRSLRLLRVFKVLKLSQFVKDSQVLSKALRASKNKIIIFLFVVLMLVMILGTIMYIVEGSEAGFTSIPRGIYWAIVTLTTVGYGDIAPVTPLGQFIASIVMIMGYAIIAVPTGIVTNELMASKKTSTSTISCPSCSKEGHDEDAIHCKFCGHQL